VRYNPAITQQMITLASCAYQVGRATGGVPQVHQDRQAQVRVYHRLHRLAARSPGGQSPTHSAEQDQGSPSTGNRAASAPAAAYLGARWRKVMSQIQFVLGHDYEGDCNRD